LALGISWVLDGLEVTTVGIIGDTLKKQCTLAVHAAATLTSVSLCTRRLLADADLFLPPYDVCVAVA
jgi:hypothetical protein